MKVTARSFLLISVLLLSGFGCNQASPAPIVEPASPQAEPIFIDDGKPLENPEGDMVAVPGEEPVSAPATTPAPPEPTLPKPAPIPTPKPTPTPEPAPIPTPAPQPLVKTFNMTAKQWAFEPSKITVSQGDEVVIIIKSVDVNHGFAIAAFGVDVTLKPDQMQTVRFTADKKGTFTFFCSEFCGSGHSSMSGTLVVE